MATGTDPTDGMLLKFIDFFVTPLFATETGLPTNTNTNYSAGNTDYVVEGIVNGISVTASQDNGSDECVISSLFASRLGLKPVAGTEKKMTLANKKSIWSPGMVEVLWKFANEKTSHKLKCWIIPGCPSNLTLGSRFLQATETFTKYFCNRVKKLVQPRRLRLRLMGEGKQRMLGSFNYKMTTALADTGSDIMVVSAEHARKLGLHVHCGQGDLYEIELADGSRTWTRGLVRNIPWAVGKETIWCDFHVMDDLPVDVILSKDYLFELNVFSKHASSFTDADLVDEISFLCGIRLIEHNDISLATLESAFLTDVTSYDAFSPENVHKERVRGDKARDKISKLPAADQEAALRLERYKRNQWKKAREAHKVLWAKSPQFPPDIDGSVGTSGGSKSPPIPDKHPGRGSRDLTAD